MTWKTDLRDYMPFPWACEHCLDKDVRSQGDFSGDGQEEFAIVCDVKPYKILECECMGMDCPDCKLRHHEEFMRELIG